MDYLITWSIWYCQYRANFTRSKLDSFLLILMAEFPALCSECATFCKPKAAGFCSWWARPALKTANISAHLWGPPIEYGNHSDHLVDSWMGSPMQWVVGFFLRSAQRSLDLVPCVVLEFTRQWHSGWSTCLQLENLWCWAQRMKFLVETWNPEFFLGIPITSC